MCINILFVIYVNQYTFLYAFFYVRAAPAIAFIEMLIEQGMLHIAVRNRNEQTIHPLFKFVNKQLGRDVTSMPVLLEFIRAILSELQEELTYQLVNINNVNTNLLPHFFLVFFL